MKKLDTLLTGLQVKEIDYDIVGLSFYPYWHGTMDDLKNAITHIRNTYGKKVYVAENAHCYTAEDGDGSANSVEGTDDLAEGYSASVQGQANEVRDVCAAASESGAEGIFYWEGTWIPVGPADADNSALGRSTAAAGPAAMHPVMIRRMPASTTADVPGTPGNV